MEIIDERKTSEKNYVTTLLLAYFLGVFGVHRFYAGKIGTGILMLLTVGGFGIWALIDMVFIMLGKFTDGDDLPILMDRMDKDTSDKDFTTTALLCYFLGVMGIHRFYVGKIGTGVVMFLTAGGFGIWAMIDFIVLVTGNFKDDEGRYVLNR